MKSFIKRNLIFLYSGVIAGTAARFFFTLYTLEWWMFTIAQAGVFILCVYLRDSEVMS